MAGIRKARWPVSQSWGLGWGAGERPALPALLLASEGPSGDAGDSTVMPTVAASGAALTERSCVPGMALSAPRSFSHLHGQIFSICSLQRSVTMWYLNDYSIRDNILTLNV